MRLSEQEYCALLKRKAAAVPKKFRNTPTNGKDSKREAKRGDELRLLQQAGAIHGLEEQKTFMLIPKQYIDGKLVEREITYTADYVYTEHDKLVVEDCKGYGNDRWPLKRKMMLWFHGIRVREV